MLVGPRGERERERPRKLFTKFPDSDVTLGENANTAANSAAYPRSVIIAEANCVGALGERCFRAGKNPRTLTRFVADLVFSPSQLYFFAILGPRHIRVRLCAFLFLFSDKNVMSEMEIAEWGPSRVLEARMEFGIA